MYQNEKKKKQKQLQSTRKPRKDEEVARAPPRNKSEWPSWEEATKVVESEWSLEPEGEAEVPEIIIVSDAVEGTFVDSDGDSRHEQVEATLTRRGREMLNEGEEIRSPTGKVIRVESEETQDYVREEESTEFEEEEERTFIPRAVSIPLKPFFSLSQAMQRKNPQLLAAGVGGAE